MCGVLIMLFMLFQTLLIVVFMELNTLDTVDFIVLNTVENVVFTLWTLVFIPFMTPVTTVLTLLNASDAAGLYCVPDVYDYRLGIFKVPSNTGHDRPALRSLSCRSSE